jgi:hypothetical protein
MKTKDISSEGPIGVDEDAVREPSFQDWAQFVSFQPRLYYRPQSMADLKGFLAGIQQGFIKADSVRVLGGLHSCSDICVSDTIIDVSGLPQTIEYNDDNSLVTVSANWHLHDFLLEISAHGKSLSATGGTDHQTLAGIISTNTAPATPHHLIYELVEWIEYLNLEPEGGAVDEKRVSKTDPAFCAVVTSLGAIGILTRIQFRLIDELFYETVQKIKKLSEVLTDLDQTSRDYEFWRIDWVPDTDIGLVWAAKRIPTADSNGDYALDQSESILMTIFNTLDKIESAGPLLDNAMRLVYAGIAMTYGEVKASGPMRNMLPVDRRAPLHVAMAEWSFDPADLAKLILTCREYYRRQGWPNLPIEIELTKTDNYYMSPWNWPGLDYIVKFNFMYLTDISQSEAERAEIIAHLHGLWEYLIQSGIRFKAHWGKINFMDPKFVSEHFEIDLFRPYIRPLFLNHYLIERLTA